LICFLLLF